MKNWYKKEYSFNIKVLSVMPDNEPLNHCRNGHEVGDEFYCEYGCPDKFYSNLMLMQAGYPPINVKFADRRKYYACFDSYYRDNDASPMVNMVGEYIKERLSQYLNLLQE